MKRLAGNRSRHHPIHQDNQSEHEQHGYRDTHHNDVDWVEAGNVFLVVGIATHTQKTPENRFYRAQNASLAAVQRWLAQIAPAISGTGITSGADTGTWATS